MKSHYRTMTPAKAERIRELYFQGRLKQRQIAEKFGMSQASVSRIVSGKVWV